jgi:RimJ/RimL family protein N-acetyltransferase
MVKLIPVQSCHKEPLRLWRNNPQLNKYFRQSTDISPEAQDIWYQTLYKSHNIQSIYFSIIEDHDETLVGCIGLHPVSWINRNAEISIFIGKGLSYIDDYYAPKALELLIQYAFTELNLHKLFAEVYSFDTKKQLLFRKLGLIEEGILKEKIFFKNKFYDSIIYSILNNVSNGS